MKLTELLETHYNPENYSEGGIIFRNGLSNIYFEVSKGKDYFETGDIFDIHHLIYFKDKKEILRFLLINMQHLDDAGMNRHMFKKFMEMCRKAGYDYPEFKVITRSIEAPDL